LTSRIGKIFAYFKLLDPANASILQAVGELGARNITLIARQTCLPVTTVRFRLERMKKAGQVLVVANPNLPKLGLAKAFMVADAHLGHQDRLFETVRNTDYWTYIIRCYGKHDGFCSYFAFPASYIKALEEYMHEAESLQAFFNPKFFWSTNTRAVPPNFSWYDFKEKRWNFDWQEWMSDVLTGNNDSAETIEDPVDYAIAVDKKDLLILKELQKDETIGFNRLAEVVGVSPQSVGSRYSEHILKRRLIVDYAVDVYPYPFEVADFYLFKIDFVDTRSLGRFANACEGRPFILSYSKIIGKNALLVNMYIVRTEFPNLIKCLNRLFIEGSVTSFFYITLDISSYRRQTISYEHFDNGKWVYDISDKTEKLRRICETS
jgi:DNA-binding Lrp family transcriptional regulator